MRPPYPAVDRDCPTHVGADPAVSLELPLSARLAWWLTAWLRGTRSPTTCSTPSPRRPGARRRRPPGRYGDARPARRRRGAPAPTGPGWRCRSRATCSGWAGPASFNDAALDVGRGGRRRRLGLVPEVVGEVVQWHVPPGGSAPAARRRRGGPGAAGGPARLGRPPGRPRRRALAARGGRPLMNLRHRPTLDAPLGTPAAVRRPGGARAAGLGHRGPGARGRRRCAVVVRDRSSAVALLQPLERAARRALVAACSPEVWPDPRTSRARGHPRRLASTRHGRAPKTLLVTLTGKDRPGVTSAIFATLAAAGVEVLDIEQIVLRRRLVLGVLVTAPRDWKKLRVAIEQTAADLGMQVEVDRGAGDNKSRQGDRSHVTAASAARSRRRPCRPSPGGSPTRGANIDRIERMARYPVTAIDLAVSGRRPRCCDRCSPPRRPSRASTSPCSASRCTAAACG